MIPWEGLPGFIVRISCGEFTSLCPVTGQADFGSLLIEYKPILHIVETKSLKLFLASYRSRRIFNEDAVEEIASRLYDQIKPMWLAVVGRFHARGGIAVEASAARGVFDHTANLSGKSDFGLSAAPKRLGMKPTKE